MTDKRDAGRQRRANQNRSARDALVTRRQAAQKVAPEPAPTAKPGRGASRAQAAPEPTPTAKPGRGASRAQAAPGPTPTAKPGRRTSRAQAAPVVPARSKATRSADGGGSGFAAPTNEDAPPAAGLLGRTRQLAGGRQMLIGFLLVLAGTPFAAFVPMFREKGSKHNESLVSLLGARALVLLLIPVVIAAIPLLTLNHRRRRLAWNIAAFLLALWVLTTGSRFYLPGLVVIIWGLMKSSRAEGPAGGGSGLFRRSPRASRDASVDATGTEVESDRVSD